MCGRYKVSCKRTLENNWLAVKSICIGEIPTGEGTPDEYYLVKKEQTPYRVFKAYGWRGYFQETCIWHNYVAIGFGEHFYLINLTNDQMHYMKCNGYFGHIYTDNLFLWISSCCDLTCIDMNGEPLWRTDQIAVDGIIVHEFDGDYVHISCEMDPPGGWIDYVLDNKTGEITNSK